MRERYAQRNGGYTRVLKVPPRVGDRAPQAILELVNGQRDMRFSMTARSVAQKELQGKSSRKDFPYYTLENMRKVIMFRPNGRKALAEEVEKQKKSLQEEREPQWYQ